MSDGPAPTRPAATVILVRAGGKHSDNSVELLMLRRGDDAGFMPGIWVFAGGIVDPADFEAAVADPTAAGEGVDSDELAHRIAGAREVGEEAAVEISADALVPWSRWITPEQVPVRFDTRFYVARAPAHCKPEADGIEMSEARWIGADEALDAFADEEFPLSFPTIRHLQALNDYETVDALMQAAAERPVEPILPRVVGTEDSFAVLIPGDTGYEET